MTISNRNRTIRAAAIAAALVVAAASPLWAAAATAGPTVVVTGADGSYRVQGWFDVPAAASVAWSVLTDYDRVSSFVTSMRSSVARRDSTGRLLVTQEAVGKAGPFSRRMQVVLDVSEEQPERIAFHDVGGESFLSYAGSWTIRPGGDGVRITYVLDARPRSAPPLFARSILGSNARTLLEQVRQEIARRGRAAAD